MGDPKRLRKRYDNPPHPWQKDRIKEEEELVKKFGLKNKREVWKAQTLLRKFRSQARLLVARERVGDVQANKEKEQLLNRLANLSILPETANLDDVLGLSVENILDRRLQTVVFNKGLANTPKQARQFIVHGHTSISGRKVTIPGYLVKKFEEDEIEYNPSSPIANDLHPMRPKPKLGIVAPTPDLTPEQAAEPSTTVEEKKD
jgi:small subunit ribosomal protein S4